MPNLDGGHYFLTMLAPVRQDTTLDPVTARSRSHRHLLAQSLALLPTGRQTADSPPDDPASPLSRNTLNHLARFVIVDGPPYNGRVSTDSLLSALRGTNPLQPQPVDRLGMSYLLFAADLDVPGIGSRPGDGDAALRAYTEALWATMQPELQDIFGHCLGFEAVATAGAFHAYVRRCQVETTMPFNDYWLDGLPVGSAASPRLEHKALVVAIVVLFCVLAVVAWGATGLLALLVVVLLALFAAYRWVAGRAMQPFARAPGSDLPTVLKALFLQQHFTRFAIEAQGLDDAALHARFAAFAAVVRPGDPTPTQPPGEVHAPPPGWAS